MSQLIELLPGINHILEMAIGCGIYMYWIEKRDWLGLRVLASLVLIIMFTRVTMPINTKVIWFFLVYLLCTFICYLSCKVSVYEAFYCSSVGYLSQHIGTNIYLLMFFRGDVLTFAGLDYYLIQTIIYSLSIFYIAPRLVKDQHLTSSKANTLVTAFLTIGIVIVMSTAVKIVADRSRLGIYDPRELKLFLLCQIFEVSLCFAILAFQMIQNVRLKEQEEFIKKEFILEQRANQLKISKDNIESIKLKCHDFKYQIAALTQNKTNGQDENYVKELQNMIEIYDVNIDSGSETLNTILMEKALYCKTHDIHWSCVADGEGLKGIDVVDLYTLMGNALDNAIEAVMQIEKKENRYILVRVYRRSNMNVITVENAYQGHIQIEDHLPITSKSDAYNHGIGLKSVKHIVNKYQGGFYLSTENQVFLLTITLPSQIK